MMYSTYRSEWQMYFSQGTHVMLYQKLHTHVNFNAMISSFTENTSARRSIQDVSCRIQLEYLKQLTKDEEIVLKDSKG